MGGVTRVQTLGPHQAVRVIVPRPRVPSRDTALESRRLGGDPVEEARTASARRCKHISEFVLPHIFSLPVQMLNEEAEWREGRKGVGRRNAKCSYGTLLPRRFFFFDEKRESERGYQRTKRDGRKAGSRAWCFWMSFGGEVDTQTNVYPVCVSKSGWAGFHKAKSALAMRFYVPAFSFFAPLQVRERRAGNSTKPVQGNDYVRSIPRKYKFS